MQAMTTTDLLVKGASLPVWSDAEMQVRRGGPIDIRLRDGRVACTSSELPPNPHEASLRRVRVGGHSGPP